MRGFVSSCPARPIGGMLCAEDQMMRSCLAMLLVWVGLTGSAMAWEEPARGTATRSALMDAIRPQAEWYLGAPVEFVAHDLRREGGLAFAMLRAQRPGGGVINPAQTPMVQRGEAEDWMDVTEIQVLYQKSGKTWVAVHYAFGASDVWFAWGPLCQQYAPVIADFCQGVQ